MLRKNPRDLLKIYSYRALEDSELIALIFGRGARGHSIYSVSKTIAIGLDTYLGTMSTEEFLKKLAGKIPNGYAYRASVGALYELLGRLRGKYLSKATAITPQDLVRQRFSFLQGKRQEYVYGVYLSARLTVRKVVLLSKGTIDYSIIEPQDVFHYALKYRSRNIILVHNHPSGDPNPSFEDIAMTNRLKEAASLLYLNFLDHIIVAKEGAYSFHSEKVVI